MPPTVSNLRLAGFSSETPPPWRFSRSESERPPRCSVSRAPRWCAACRTAISAEERPFAKLVAPPFLTIIISGFAACALLIAAVGLYGIVAYGVAQRTREVGIRIALGASERSVVALVVREGLLFVLLGAAGGLFGAVASSGLLAALLFETKTSDAPTLAAVSILLVSVALVSSYLPARRAAKTDPMLAMRAD